VKIGRPDAWWNRRVPIGRLCLAMGVVLACLYVWLAYGDLISSIVWGVRHQRTANFRGQTLQVPWFWREKTWTNYNEFELTRQYAGLTLPSNIIVRYQNISPDDVESTVERMKRMSNESAQKFQIPDLFYRDYDGNDFTKTHYLCMERGFSRSLMLFVECYSRDGRWSVSMWGLKQTRPELETILDGVASMGNPTK
jgi:hypothetical protein